jgi:hypothetical protein
MRQLTWFTLTNKYVSHKTPEDTSQALFGPEIVFNND